MKEKSKNISFDFPLYDEIPDTLGSITALYLRVSTDSQAQEGYGLDVQYDALKKYVLAYDIPNAVVFVDDGYTGMNENRPAFQKLLDCMRRGRVKFVMTYALDRIARLQMPILRFLKEDCKLANCDFLAVKDNIDSRNKQTFNILISILSMFAELDHDAIVSKLFQGRKQRALDGYWKGGGNPPFGYYYSKELNDLIPDPDKAPLVKQVFLMYNSLQYTPRQIAEAVGLSSDTAVLGVLRNRTYLGEITFRGEQYAGKHHPLIDEETFARAQEILKSRSVVRTHSQYLLSSLLYCGNCGARMRYMLYGKGERQTLKILCYSRFASTKKSLVKDHACPNFIYDAEEVERAVTAQIMQFSVEYRDEIKHRRVKQEDVIDGLNARGEQLKIEYDRLLNAYRKLGNEEILERAAEVDAERKKIARDIAEEREKQSMTKKIMAQEEMIKTLSGTWKEMSARERQAIMRDLIEKVILTEGELKIVLNKTEYEKKLSNED